MSCMRAAPGSGPPVNLLRWGPWYVKIYATLSDHLGEGFVWLAKPGLAPRCVVKITNPQSNRTVYCEALQFDENFLTRYNQHPRITISNEEASIVMGSWYRARLGNLETQKDYPLEIVSANSWPAKLRMCVGHPQLVVRVAVWLGIISVALGGVGVLLGFLSVWPKT